MPFETIGSPLLWAGFIALVMRAVFVVVGGAFLQRFHAAIYVFGAILAITGIKLLLQRNQELHPERNPLVRASRRGVAKRRPSRTMVRSSRSR